jgi:predicted HicB family RNase H-like nuclease
VTVDKRAQAQARREAILAEYAEEEAEAAEVEVAENAAALDVPLNLRITRALDAQLRQRAAAEQVPISALVRRLLTRSVQDRSTPEMTVQQVEAIARRIANEAVAARS